MTLLGADRGRRAARRARRARASRRAAEHALVVERVQRAPRAHVPPTTLIGLIEAQAARTPDAHRRSSSATETLTYAELNARANRLARHLVALRRRPGALVAVARAALRSTWWSPCSPCSRRAAPICRSTPTTRPSASRTCWATPARPASIADRADRVPPAPAARSRPRRGPTCDGVPGTDPGARAHPARTPRTSSTPPAPPAGPRASSSRTRAIVNRLRWMQARSTPSPPATGCCRRPRPASTCRSGSSSGRCASARRSSSPSPAATRTRPTWPA